MESLWSTVNKGKDDGKQGGLSTKEDAYPQHPRELSTQKGFRLGRPFFASGAESLPYVQDVAPQVSIGIHLLRDALAGMKDR